LLRQLTGIFEVFTLVIGLSIKIERQGMFGVNLLECFNLLASFI